jgi:hypothetical protein
MTLIPGKPEPCRCQLGRLATLQYRANDLRKRTGETRGRRQILALDAEPRRHRLDVNDMDESDRPQLKHIEVPGSVINVEAVL